MEMEIDVFKPHVRAAGGISSGCLVAHHLGAPYPIVRPLEGLRCLELGRNPLAFEHAQIQSVVVKRGSVRLSLPTPYAASSSGRR